jgi:PAS domain S-box-containing protein
MNNRQNDNESKKALLKHLLTELNKGEEPAKELREQCKKLLSDLTPMELSRIEEELIKAGMPKKNMMKLCDIHIALQKETMGEEKAIAPPGHPIHALMEEHKKILQFADELKDIVEEIKWADDFGAVENKMEQLHTIKKHLEDSEKHYLREENVLFPYLEKHGITQPPAIMWTEHNDIREKERTFYQLLEDYKNKEFKNFVKELEQTVKLLAQRLSTHFFKENNILFPAAMRVILGEEWGEIISQFNEIGYCSFTPESAKAMIKKGEKSMSEQPDFSGDSISLETGIFSAEELETLLNSLPIDITFVDKDDKVRYFSQSKDRIFVRTKAIIGRTVQKCHPEKSVHLVEQILSDFKQGKREVAEFWLKLNERLIYIRYFPLRNEKDEYLGCLEVTQDITDIKKIEGEKRLL